MKTITLGLNDFVGSMGLTDWWYICSHHCNSTSGIYFLLLQQQERCWQVMTAGAVKG